MQLIPSLAYLFLYIFIYARPWGAGCNVYIYYPFVIDKATQSSDDYQDHERSFYTPYLIRTTCVASAVSMLFVEYPCNTYYLSTVHLLRLVQTFYIIVENKVDDLHGKSIVNFAHKTTNLLMIKLSKIKSNLSRTHSSLFVKWYRQFRTSTHRSPKEIASTVSVTITVS